MTKLSLKNEYQFLNRYHWKRVLSKVICIYLCMCTLSPLFCSREHDWCPLEVGFSCCYQKNVLPLGDWNPIPVLPRLHYNVHCPWHWCRGIVGIKKINVFSINVFSVTEQLKYLIREAYWEVMMTPWHGNAFHSIGPLWGESSSNNNIARWCFLCWWPKLAV